MSKELIKKIVQRLNTVPVGIKFNFGPREPWEEFTHTKPLNFCELVYRAMKTGKTYLIDCSLISCQAAREVFGIEDEKLSNLRSHFRKILNDTISGDDADKILIHSEILKLNDRPNSITIGALIPEPDIYILFLNSNRCDMVVKAYTRLFYNDKVGVVIDASNIMPVCYNCTVRPFLKGNISISWVVGDNENCNEFLKNCMVIGIPGDKMEEFINTIEEDVGESLHIKEV